jgi:hypothetical protein
MMVSVAIRPLVYKKILTIQAAFQSPQEFSHGICQIPVIDYSLDRYPEHVGGGEGLETPD